MRNRKRETANYVNQRRTKTVMQNNSGEKKIELYVVIVI